MRQILAVTILLAVAGFAGLGFFVMSHEGAHGHHGCVAASALGTTCPDAGDIVGFLGFHIGAFKSFSNAVFTVFSLIAFTASLHIFAWHTRIRKVRFLLERKIALARDVSLGFFEKPFIQWLALHENSPALA